MATEIERKFLVKGEYKHLAERSENIIQAYLSIIPERTIRIRITDEMAILTIKGIQHEGTISRKEWEIELPCKDALEMIKICLPGTIEKTRYYIPFEQHTIEVDEFHGKNEGLVIAEIELGTEEEIYHKPDWLGKEVTCNPAYFNSNLIK